MNSYGEAFRRLEELDARENAVIAPNMRSQLYGHERRTATSIVLFHGLTSSPRQCARLAAALSAQGHNVVVPRLPRHGHVNRLTLALADLRREDLIATILESIEVGRLVGERVAVVGFSLGGLLAAWAAQFVPDLEHVTCIAPFLGIFGLPYEAEQVLARVVDRLPNLFLWWDPILRHRQMPAHGYPRYPTHAIATCQRLAAEILAAADATPPAAKRLLVITNAREVSVNNRTIMRLVTAWRAHGASVDLHVLRHLPPSHDIIEPLRRRRLFRYVYPTLLALLRDALHARAA